MVHVWHMAMGYGTYMVRIWHMVYGTWYTHGTHDGT